MSKWNKFCQRHSGMGYNMKELSEKYKIFNQMGGTYTIEDINSIKIMSINVLAPELMLYFWRSSYGIKVYSKEQCDKIHKTRIDNIIKIIKREVPDVLCLQEVTNSTYQYLNNMKIGDYIGSFTNMYVINESFKDSIFKYNYPPMEQRTSYWCDSGVCTLLKDNLFYLKHVTDVANAETFGASKLFKSGVGSPMTVDLITYQGKSLYIVNVHIRMMYPSIKLPLKEIYDRLLSLKINLNDTIIIGDFNAHGKVPTKELFTSPFYKEMTDLLGSELVDDHVFIGNKLRNNKNSVKILTDVPLLEMDVNLPTSDRKWGNKETPYTQSKVNNNLIETNKVSTDHAPIVCVLNFSSKNSQYNIL